MTTRLLTAAFAIFYMLQPACAQEVQTKTNLFFGDIVYKHKKKVRARNIFNNLLGAVDVATGNSKSASFSATKECPEDSTIVKESIKEGAMTHSMFVVYEGSEAADHLSEGGVILSAVITDIYTQSDIAAGVNAGSNNWAKVKFQLTLTDAATRKEIATTKLDTKDIGDYYIRDVGLAESNVINQRVTYATYKFLLKKYPLVVDVLDKGYEKESGKLKSIYIGMGQKENTQKNWELFIVKASDLVNNGQGKQQTIGRIRVSEVQGNDVSICRIKSGEDKIKAALDNGEKLVAITNAGDDYSY